MAEDKRGILIYADWIKKFEALEDSEAGKLIKHFFRYVNDLNPTAPDRMTELLFIDIETTLKRDLKKWEKRAERSRNNGKTGGRPSEQKNPEKPRITQQVILKPRKPDSDSVSVTVSDTVTVTDNVIETKEKIRPNVFLHRKEIEKLSCDYTDEDREWMYDKLSHYKLANGKKYKSDYGAILTWVTRSLKEEKEKNSAKKENNGKPTKQSPTESISKF